ncbi:hypothetical protein IGI04_030970 [Brassica rapa subsp. trilocularis]|uniref:Homeobox domain-containing protein n=1 Tax=Brassica rapa subsp. trilocularis TaxID=1813537 RepID=A0ABQ7LVJ7_BRACM|nr:hypothetical protein IGI04_030970 [Brassica rapa subsp. trilocularis]
MYEDHQVAKSGKEGGHMVTNYSDNIFGSASSSPTGTVQNPDFKLSTFLNPNFSYVIPKEEYGMMSMTENGSAWSVNNPVEDSAIEQQLPPVKKKRLHRHSTHQIQEMEAFFKVNPHPNDDDKTRLSEELGLTPLQVKFWFQNRRNQIKIEQDRSDNKMLKAENETLKTENRKLQFDLQRLSCSSCGGSRDKLHLENYRLRQELDRLHSIASLMNPCLPPPETACLFPDMKDDITNNLLIAEEDKAIAMDLAVSCVQELAKMCATNEPLWNKKGSDNERISLNEDVYKKMFQWPSVDHNHFRREASRANTVVIMNSITLVNAFLDADKWSEMFCSIVSRAKTIQIVSSEVSGASGSLLLMYAELQVLSPLVPAREIYFLRYVKQNAEAGKWMIVDFPVDGLIKPASGITTTDQYRRKPSGFIIQDMSNGYSQITWVEHVEVEEKHVHHKMVREYVESGAAFGAERWLAVLRRQCERMASLMATNITDLGVIPSVEAKRKLMKLSQNMVRTYCLTISNSYGQALSESPKETVRITTRKVCGGVVLCGVSTTLLPYSHHQVFDLLRHDHGRSQMEMLFNENPFQEVAHIANGSHPGNCISLLHFHGASSSNNVEWMLQETCTDNSGSLVVYSTVHANAVQLAMNGEDPSRIPLLPLGFSVVPVNQPHVVEGISVNLDSCLLTVAIQVLVSNATTATLNLSTTAINNRICSTVYRISSALGSPLLPEIPSSFKQEISN